ncbi:unnamed protein product [Cladocopium goreaui]|uniref:Uncharacterized protein n=1 Tax=Cladocopium goreaui TaxID=2562237 RepID=A0A9P1BIU5_9DINO|nr:unnamed protein product [Cladocopium goreaui]
MDSPGTGIRDDQAGPKEAAAGAGLLFRRDGGVTYGEIAALRRLAQLEEGRRRFLIVTSEYINPKKLFESMRCEAVLNLPPLDATKTAASGEARRGFGGFWPTAR